MSSNSTYYVKYIIKIDILRFFFIVKTLLYHLTYLTIMSEK